LFLFFFHMPGPAPKEIGLFFGVEEWMRLFTRLSVQSVSIFGGVHLR
jgi:hypothetical protein